MPCQTQDQAYSLFFSPRATQLRPHFHKAVIRNLTEADRVHLFSPTNKVPRSLYSCLRGPNNTTEIENVPASGMPLGASARCARGAPAPRLGVLAD